MQVLRLPVLALGAGLLTGCATARSIEREPRSSIPNACPIEARAEAPSQIPVEWIGPADPWAEQLGIDGPSGVTAAIPAVEERFVPDEERFGRDEFRGDPHWGVGALGAALAPDGDLVVVWACNEDLRPLFPRCTGRNFHIEKVRRTDGATEWDWVVAPDVFSRAMPAASTGARPVFSSPITFAISPTGAVAIAGLFGFQPWSPAHPYMFLAMVDAKGREVFVQNMSRGAFVRLGTLRASTQRFAPKAPRVARRPIGAVTTIVRSTWAAASASRREEYGTYAI